MLTSAEKLATIVCVASVWLILPTPRHVHFKECRLECKQMLSTLIISIPNIKLLKYSKEGYSSKHYMLKLAHINPSEYLRVYTTAKY